MSALFTRLLALALLQISSLSALLCHSGLYSNVCPSERTFLFILAIVSSKLSLSHHPVSHSWSINILLPRLAFVSSTMTFGKTCPDSSRPWEMWGLRMWAVLPEALLPSLSLFLSCTGLVFHHLLHQNMQSPILRTSLCSYQHSLLIFWLVTIHPSAIVFKHDFFHYPQKLPSALLPDIPNCILIVGLLASLLYG